METQGAHLEAVLRERFHGLAVVGGFGDGLDGLESLLVERDEVRAGVRDDVQAHDARGFLSGRQQRPREAPKKHGAGPSVCAAAPVLVRDARDVRSALPCRPVRERSAAGVPDEPAGVAPAPRLWCAAPAARAEPQPNQAPAMPAPPHFHAGPPQWSFSPSLDPSLDPSHPTCADFLDIYGHKKNISHSNAIFISLVSKFKKP